MLNICPSFWIYSSKSNYDQTIISYYYEAARCSARWPPLTGSKWFVVCIQLFKCTMGHSSLALAAHKYLLYNGKVNKCACVSCTHCSSLTVDPCYEMILYPERLWWIQAWIHVRLPECIRICQWNGCTPSVALTFPHDLNTLSFPMQNIHPGGKNGHESREKKWNGIQHIL